MLKVALKVTEQTTESYNFLGKFTSNGFAHVAEENSVPVDVLIIADRTGQFEDRKRIYEVHFHLISPDTEIFYIFPGGIRFQQIQVHEGHDKFFHVGAFELNFWSIAFDEAHRFVNATKEHRLKLF